nr:hypothetical protein [Neobacillus sp. Marseille-Q6967]
MLRQLLHKNGTPFSIKSNVIFINPAYTLYQAPLNEPIIYPTQVKRFLSELDLKPSKLNDRHRNLAEFLVSTHKPLSPYHRLPTYTYDQLRKGMTSSCCHSLFVGASETKIICGNCGQEEDIQSAVVRV